MTSDRRSLSSDPGSNATALEAPGAREEDLDQEGEATICPWRCGAITDVHPHTSTKAVMQPLALDVSVAFSVLPT